MMALSMSKWVGFLFRASGDCGEGTTKTFPCVPCGVGTGPKRTSICNLLFSYEKTVGGISSHVIRVRLLEICGTALFTHLVHN